MLRSFATAMPVVAVLTPIVVTTAVMTAAMVSLSLRVMAFLLDESGAKECGRQSMRHSEANREVPPRAHGVVTPLIDPFSDSIVAVQRGWYRAVKTVFRNFVQSTWNV